MAIDRPAEGPEDEFGPLRLERHALGIPFCVDAADRSTIQLVFIEGPTQAGVTELTLEETHKTVRVALYTRVVAGAYPDGRIAIEAAVPSGGAIEIGLERPLGRRRVINAANRHEVEIVDADHPMAARELARGCPRWITAGDSSSGP